MVTIADIIILVKWPMFILVTRNWFLTVSVKMKDDTFAPFNVNCQVSSLLKMSTLYQLYINLNRYIAPLSNRNCDNTEQNFLPKTTSFMF